MTRVRDELLTYNLTDGYRVYNNFWMLYTSI